jgi:hypothetical protein
MPASEFFLAEFRIKHIIWRRWTLLLPLFILGISGFGVAWVYEFNNSNGALPYLVHDGLWMAAGFYYIVVTFVNAILVKKYNEASAWPYYLDAFISSVFLGLSIWFGWAHHTDSDWKIYIEGADVAALMFVVTVNFIRLADMSSTADKPLLAKVVDTTGGIPPGGSADPEKKKLVNTRDLNSIAVDED